MSPVVTFTKPGEDPWSDLVPFGEAKPPKLDLDEVIPPALGHLRDFILATAEAIQVPVEGVAPISLALVSLAASRSFEVELLPQWRETAPLWFLVLAESGERKSALLASLLGPLNRWQEAEASRLGSYLARYGETRRGIEAELAGLRSKIGRAAPEDRAKRKSEAEILAEKLEGMPPLSAPDLVTADATPEAVRNLLVANGEKLGIFAAETDAETLTGKRYSKNGGTNLNLFLSAFTGDPIPAHRIGLSFRLQRPSLAIGLCVQPSAVSEVLSDPMAHGRGLVSRMLFVQPASRMGSRSLNPEPVPAALAEWWSVTLRTILDCPWPGRVVLAGEGPVRCQKPSRVLTLDQDAHEAFCLLREAIELRLKIDGDLRPISGFASKLPGVVARISLDFQLMENIGATTISLPAMKAACAWAPFLIGHFQAVLGYASERPAKRHARRLADALRQKGIRETTERECFRLLDHIPGIKKMDDLAPVLVELHAANYLRPLPYEPLQGEKGRPPSPRLEVNPLLFA
jgi:hypothetical protein